MTSDERIPMRELEQRTGLSRMTINFYIKEGLLPEPERTARNMAYYSQATIERLRLIARLRNDYHLSLPQIRIMLASELLERDLLLLMDVRDRIFWQLSTRADDVTLSIDDLAGQSGLDAPALEWMEQNGLIFPQPAEGAAGKRYHADSLAVAQLMQRMRALEIKPEEFLPVLQAIDQISLVHQQLVARHVVETPGVSSTEQKQAELALLDMSFSIIVLVMLRKSLQTVENNET